MPQHLGKRPCVASLRNWSQDRREAWAQDLLDRLTPAMSALGVLFLLVVLGEQFARPGSAVSTALTVVGWVLWAVFAAEFLARMVVAPSTGRFLRRNWWQVLFLVLPFLRILRLVRAIRVLRTGRVLSSTVRSSRSVRQVLGGRVAWLVVVTAILILGSSQLLYGFGDYPSYGVALHATALAAITGEPLGRPDPFAQVLEVLLAIFSVVVFATLAGTLGAYFLNGTAAHEARDENGTFAESPPLSPDREG
jgi:voltage-gated potassium channel